MQSHEWELRNWWDKDSEEINKAEWEKKERERARTVDEKERGHFVKTLAADSSELKILYDHWRCHIWWTVQKNSWYLQRLHTDNCEQWTDCQRLSGVKTPSRTPLKSISSLTSTSPARYELSGAILPIEACYSRHTAETCCSSGTQSDFL